MYRSRSYAQVLYGKFNEYLESLNQLNAIARKRGWPESSTWIPVVGTANEVVTEEEYADLATFAKVSDAFSADPEAMRIFRASAGLIVQGSARNELFEEVTKPLA